MRRACRRGDLLPLGEVAANRVEVAVAAHRRIGEIGERPAADERMEGDARGVEDPNEVLVRLAEPLSGKRQPASREGGEGKHRVRPQRDEHRLGLGDQALGGLVLALLRTCDRLGEPRGHHVPQRADLLRDPRTFGRARDRLAYRAAMKVGPCLEHERVGEQAQPPLRPERPRPLPGGREVASVSAQTDDAATPTSNSCSGSDMPTGDSRSTCSTTCLPLPIGSINPRTHKRTGVVGRHRDLVGDRGNLSPRLVVQPLPVGAHGDRGERLEGSSPLTAVHQLARDSREVADRGRARPRALGQLQVERGDRVFGSREADLLRRPEQTHALSRTAELARQVACEEEPLCAALRVGGQLCGALEG